MFRSGTTTKTLFALLISALIITACGSSGRGGNKNNPQDDWLVPISDLADGGPGLDGIPAIESPQFESVSTITSVAPNDLLVVLQSGGQVKAYPHDIMDYHEVVNDGPADALFSMSYCPLTASAVAWEGIILSGADPTFGTSGLLYNSNLLLYDRATGSLWSQMLQLAVNGLLIGDEPNRIRLFETSLSTLRIMYPDALVMTRDTGHSRNYDEYLYGNYRSVPQLLFEVSRISNLLGQKVRLIGIHTDAKSKVYQLGAFGSTTQTINDQFEDQAIVIVGNSALSYAAIYSRELSDGTILSFNPVQDDLPNVMTDTEGNVWDIFGTAVSGPRVGVQLAQTKSYVAMWFAWYAHFLDVEIHFN